MLIYWGLMQGGANASAGVHLLVAGWDKSAGLLGGLPTYAAFPGQALVTDVVGQRVELAVSADDEDVVIGDRAEGF